jgi:hypothetical protein
MVSLPPVVNCFVQLGLATFVPHETDFNRFWVFKAYQAATISENGMCVPYIADEEGGPMNFCYDGAVQCDADETSESLQAKIVTDCRSAFGLPNLQVTFLHDTPSPSL